MSSIIPGAAIFRPLLFGEATLNILGALPMLFSPQASLSYIVKDPSHITPALTQFLQWSGVFVIGLTIPLLQAAPDTPEGIATRRAAYLQLGVCEILMSALLAKQWFDGESAFTGDLVAGLTLPMLSACAFRIYAGIVNPDMMGWVVSESDKKKQ